MAGGLICHPSVIPSVFKGALFWDRRRPRLPPSATQSTLADIAGEDACGPRRARPIYSMASPNGNNEKLDKMTAEIRDLLFGDLPAESWPVDTSNSPHAPWKLFVSARTFAAAGDNENAKQKLREVLALTGLESRHYLQAWHFLRELGEQPLPREAKNLYGVVVEVALDEGVDVVAAYADHSARYFNYSGAAIVWDRPNGSLDGVIDALLSAGKTVAEQIGPWDGPRPAAPPTGQARISLLVPAGLHFGQGPYQALAADPMGGPVLGAALNLMQSLIAIQDGKE